MAKSKGFLALIGLKKATTWGTALAVGAGDGLEVTSIGVVGNRQIVQDRSITGKVSTREGDKGNIVVAGAAMFPLRYEGTGRLIAGLLGTAGVPATVDISARKHTFKIADTTDGIFFTLAYEIIKDATIYEFNTLKIRRLTLRATVPGRVELEVEFLGHDFTDASAINTTTTIDTVTLPANREIAQARQLTVRMNDQSAGALAAGDAKYLSAFELTIERPLDADFTTEFGDRSSEPMPPSGEGAFLNASGNLTFSQLDNAATGGNSPLVLKQLNRTTQKLDAVFAGDTLVGTATEKVSHKLYLPMIVLGEGKPTLSQGSPVWGIPFTAHRVGTAPTGFDATYTEPVTWENMNSLTGDTLA